MNIQSPLSNLCEVKELSLAGADEFYCGVIPDNWLEKYGFEVPINCRGAYRGSNFHQLSELYEAVNIAHYYDKKVYVAFNENSYNQDQVDLICHTISNLSDNKVDGIIISSVGLLSQIREMNLSLKVIISSEANCTNASAVEFFKQLGAKRIVFPRHVSIREIGEIINKCNEMEFEAFMLNEGCFFNGGHCYSIHHQEYSHLCRALRYDLKPIGSKYDEKEFLDIVKDHYIKYSGSHRRNNDLSNSITKCGLCSLKYLDRVGVDYFKIVGRTAVLKEKIKWVKVLKKAIELVSEIEDNYEYSDICKSSIFGDDSKIFCDKKKYCYYPDEI